MIGVNLQLFDNTTPRANLSNIQAMWWDVTEPKDGTSPIGKSSSVTTDANGYINLDLSKVTGLSTGDYGFLMLYKLDGTDYKDSSVFAGKVQTSDITSGVDMYYYNSGWTRPTDWPEIDSPVNGVEKVQGLFAVYDVETGGNGVALICNDNYTVDWGDGTVLNYNPGVTAEHIYDYSNSNLSPATSEGFKCAVVTITPQSGHHLTSVDFNVTHSNYTPTKVVPWLEFAFNGSYITNITISHGTTTNIFPYMLYQVSLGENAITDMTQLFYECSLLQSIPLFNMSSATSLNSLFYSCSSLRSVPPMDTSSVTDMAGMFAKCTSLMSIPPMDTSLVTTMNSIFEWDYMLRTIPFMDTSSVTDMRYMFYSCKSLQSIPILDASSVIETDYMFSQCPSLQKGALSGLKVTTSYYACKLGPDALNEIYSNLAASGYSPVLNVKGNWGVGSDNQSLVPAGWTVNDS